MKILEFLVIELQMNPAVCNVFIDYILKTQDNKLVKGFVEAVASDWKKANLETAKEAMEYAERSHKKMMKFKENKDKPRVVKKEEVIPEWFNKAQKREDMDTETKSELEGFFKEFV